MFYSEPTHLQGIVTKVPNQILDKIQENYGKNTTAFRFSSQFTKIEQTWNEKYEELGGTIWGIDKNNTKTLIFSQFKNGYNGQFNLNEEEDLTSTKVFDLEYGAEIIVAFQYGGDEEEYANDEEGNSNQKEDYFDWIVVYKLFNGELKEILSYECA